MVKRRGGVKDGTTGQLAVPWRRSASAGRTRWPNPEIRCFPHRSNTALQPGAVLAELLQGVKTHLYLYADCALRPTGPCRATVQ